VVVGDWRLTIGGVEMDYASLRAQATIARLEAIGDSGDVRLLLCPPGPTWSWTFPQVADRPRHRRATHGGQVVIPGFGPPMTLTHVPRAVAAGGLHHVDGRAIYVSRGVGHERGQARGCGSSARRNQPDHAGERRGRSQVASLSELSL